MKKARKVSIDVNKILSFKSKEQYLQHAFNSALWYSCETSKSTLAIRKKLKDKGYPDEPVRFKNIKGDIETIHFIDETMKYIIENDYVNDERLIELFIESGLNAHKSLLKIKLDLSRKDFDMDMINEKIDEYESESKIKNSIEKHINVFMKRSNIKKLEPFERNKKLYASLIGKGFNYSEVKEVLEEYLEKTGSFDEY